MCIRDSNKINHIELIDGKKHWVINTDTIIDDRKKNYVLKPAHCSYGVWNDRGYKNDRMLVVAGKKLLILDGLTNAVGTFPVDYVIMNYIPKPEELEQVQKQYNPVQIVLGNNISRTKQEAIADYADAKGIHILSLIHI